MRRLDESHEGKFARSIKLGEDNAECLCQMKRWCKHVEIEQVSGGLYAQITRLPIASHSIGCPKVKAGWQSMNLRWIFSDFLVQHCADCRHHDPNGDTSWGREIIDSSREEVRRREQTAKEEADRISQFRSELLLKSKDISAEAEPESYRILKFLEEIFSEQEVDINEASGRLKQSACKSIQVKPVASRTSGIEV